MPDRDERRHRHEGHPARAAHEQLRGRGDLSTRARGMFAGVNYVTERAYSPRRLLLVKFLLVLRTLFAVPVEF